MLNQANDNTPLAERMDFYRIDLVISKVEATIKRILESGILR